MHTLNEFLLFGSLGGQKHSTGWAKIATGWGIAHPVNMLSEALGAIIYFAPQKHLKKTKKSDEQTGFGSTLGLASAWVSPPPKASLDPPVLPFAYCAHLQGTSHLYRVPLICSGGLLLEERDTVRYHLSRCLLSAVGTDRTSLLSRRPAVDSS